MMNLTQKDSSWSGNTLASIKKVLSTAVSKEGHADSLLVHMKVHIAVGFLVKGTTVNSASYCKHIR